MTVKEAIEYLSAILENRLTCNGPERDTLRLAMKIIKEAVLDKKEDAVG